MGAAGSRLSSRLVDAPSEEIQDSASENVVAIPGNHMSGTAHIGELDLRETREKCVSAFLADKVTHLPPNQKHGHTVPQDRVDRCVHAIGVGDLKGRKW